MRILLGHGFGARPTFGEQWIEDWLQRLRAAGFDVRPLRLDVDVPGGRLAWPELDRRWRRGERELLTQYERIAQACSSADVLVNYGGLNLHPDFLAQLPSTNVLAFFDDPESSAEYSRHVAIAHDLCLVGNVAEVGTYRNWGARNAIWWPLGFRADDYDASLDSDRIRREPRDVDVALLCERRTHFRRANVDRFALAFPQGVYRGPGWPLGFLPEQDRVPLLQRTRIGFNMHNSTGPINFRTFYLPANGVLQLCDNKQHLAKVFELDKEVVGYDTVTEAIDLCRYYLDHDRERGEIAAAGWKRTVTDYNEVAVFRRLVEAVQPLIPPVRRVEGTPTVYLQRHRARTATRRVAHAGAAPVTVPVRTGLRILRGVYRRLLRIRDDGNLWLRSRRRDQG